MRARIRIGERFASRSRRAHVAGLVLGLACLAATYEVAHAQAEDETTEGDTKAKVKEAGSALKRVGSYALVIGGFSMVALGVARTFSSSLSYPQARLMLTNLLRTNAYQAELVSKKMEGTFCEAIAAAMKIGGMAQSQDPSVIASATIPTYDATGQAVLGRWSMVMTKAKLGVTAALAGSAIGISDGAVLPAIIAVLALGGFVRLFLYRQEVESNLIRARAEVLPEVDQAIASGRFVTPPPMRPSR